MGSDLISRKMVMEFLQQRHAGAIIEGCHAEPAMEDVYAGIQSEVGRIMDFIVQAPAAYDVDEVVENMKAEAARWEESGTEYRDDRELGVAEGYRKAIEIVKAGVADG